MAVAVQQQIVKPGYKQTEVGVIPAEWNLRDLEALASVIDGDRGTHYPSAGEFSSSGHCLFLNAGNVTNDGFTFVDCTFITQQKDALLNKGKLKRSDIVLTTRGTVGNFAYYATAVPFDNIRINSGMVILRNESSSLDTAFFYVLLKSHLIRSQIERFSFGSAQPQLTVRGISKFKVLVPPLPEQRAIAAALADVDELIKTLDEFIAKKRDLKQAAMEQLLTGKKRLPGFREAWDVKRIGDVADVNCDNLGSNTPLNYQFNYIALEDVDCGTLKRCSEQVFRSAPSRARRKLRKGDVLVATVRPNLQSHLLFGVGTPDWICSTGFAVIRCKEQVTHPAYIFFHLFGSVISKQIETLLTGSNYPAIGGGDVKSLDLPMPTFDEQAAIATVLSDMDAEITALEQKRDKARALKQGMMQELLTGKTRLI